MSSWGRNAGRYLVAGDALISRPSATTNGKRQLGKLDGKSFAFQPLMDVPVQWIITLRFWGGALRMPRFAKPQVDSLQSNGPPGPNRSVRGCLHHSPLPV